LSSRKSAIQAHCDLGVCGLDICTVESQLPELQLSKEIGYLNTKNPTVALQTWILS